MAALTAQAIHDGPQLPVFVRLGHHEKALYLDLGDATGRAVEVTGTGWRLVDSCPVRFRRPGNLHPLPIPQAGGKLEDLRQFINVAEPDWPLLGGWMVAAFNPHGGLPVLILQGEQGSAKSSTARFLRRLLDPCRGLIGAPPREIRDLMVTAENSFVVALDNLSGLSGDLSDALCRLSTGGGFRVRALYENAEEHVCDARRPIILTGIAEVARRSDLLDRCFLLTLPPIPEEQRRCEQDLGEEFQTAWPRLLGALLTAVEGALARRASVTLDRLPRLADTALWVTAAEPALRWPARTFLQALEGNRAVGHETALESSPVWPVLKPWLEQQPGEEWVGSVGKLLEALTGELRDGRRPQGWPGNPQALTAALDRLAPNLRAVGVGFERRRRGKGGLRSVRLYQSGGYHVTHATLSPPAAETDPGAPIRVPNGPKSRCEELFDDYPGDAVGDAAGDVGSGGTSPTASLETPSSALDSAESDPDSAPFRLNSDDEDAGDGGDEVPPTLPPVGVL
ncbi:MAG: hypothetical protein FJX77_10000 [Armatimonadetes bacterium]|nr:hypothetical protein [Armatimonadota bacterium]